MVVYLICCGHPSNLKKSSKGPGKLEALSLNPVPPHTKLLRERKNREAKKINLSNHRSFTALSTFSSTVIFFPLKEFVFFFSSKGIDFHFKTFSSCRSSLYKPVSA
jgi:hypothetical protein